MFTRTSSMGRWNVPPTTPCQALAAAPDAMGLLAGLVCTTTSVAVPAGSIRGVDRVSRPGPAALHDCDGGADQQWSRG
jgi:hypothetical protein